MFMLLNFQSRGLSWQDCQTEGNNGGSGIETHIFDLQVKQVKRLAVSGQFGSMNLGTDELDGGVYLYHIKFSNGESDKAKLVIIK
ncbi:MAG: hypothetical protein IT258_14775 [Saprospiraceae bacterium]|nr:hypothetical protein [Saprospiraceae bacterium]